MMALNAETENVTLNAETKNVTLNVKLRSDDDFERQTRSDDGFEY